MGGYGKTISHLIIGLKTAKGTKQLKLDPSIYESLQKEHVEVQILISTIVYFYMWQDLDTGGGASYFQTLLGYLRAT